MWQEWDPDDVLNNDFSTGGTSEGGESEGSAGDEGADQVQENVCKISQAICFYTCCQWVAIHK